MALPCSFSARCQEKHIASTLWALESHWREFIQRRGRSCNPNQLGIPSCRVREQAAEHYSLYCSPGQWVQFAGLKILVRPDFKDIQLKHSWWLPLEVFTQPFHSVNKLLIKRCNIKTKMKGKRLKNKPGKHWYDASVTNEYQMQSFMFQNPFCISFN